jgi:serine/threonine protein kinase
VFQAVDWWSFGTLVYEMICGLPPFYDTNVQRMYHKILHAPLRFPSNLSKEAKDCLHGLLQRKVRMQRLACSHSPSRKAFPAAFFLLFFFLLVFFLRFSFDSSAAHEGVSPLPFSLCFRRFVLSTPQRVSCLKVEARLGSSAAGSADIKAHAWFADLDWDKVGVCEQLD